VIRDWYRFLFDVCGSASFMLVPQALRLIVLHFQFFTAKGNRKIKTIKHDLQNYSFVNSKVTPAMIVLDWI